MSLLNRLDHEFPVFAAGPDAAAAWREWSTRPEFAGATGIADLPRFVAQRLRENRQAQALELLLRETGSGGWVGETAGRVLLQMFLPAARRLVDDLAWTGWDVDELVAVVIAGFYETMHALARKARLQFPARQLVLRWRLRVMRSADRVAAKERLTIGSDHLLEAAPAYGRPYAEQPAGEELLGLVVAAVRSGQLGLVDAQVLVDVDLNDLSLRSLAGGRNGVRKNLAKRRNRAKSALIAAAA